jgi:hypothetical protein
MAPTKQRAAPKSKGSASKASSKSRATKSRSTNKSPPKSKSASPSSSNGSERVEGIRHGVEEKAKSAGQTVGKAAGKAKVPLIASGAALAGMAGGIVLATRQDRHRRLAMAMRKPRIKLTSKDVAKATREVGHFSSQVGELATELRRARERNGGSARRRSPVEVVLDGLTARR